MNRKKLLFTAAFFALFTFVGHSFGTLLPHEPETESLRQAYATMESTMVQMPVGSPRSLAQMAYGGNAFISLYLLICGILFILLAKPERYVRSVVLLNSVSLVGAAILSIVFYFPVPAICTALSAICGFIAARQSIKPA